MRRHGGLVTLSFLLPYAIVFFFVRLLPSLLGIGVSMFSWNIIGTPKFNGFTNFVKLFGDRHFLAALSHTLVLLAACVPLLLVISFGLAVLLNRKIGLRNAARSMIFLPYVLMPAAIGIMWKWFYDANYGLLNYYIGLAGLPAQAWLTNQSMALASICITTVWWLVGYNVVLLLAGLQGIPSDLYESANIDGASPWKAMLHITIPMLTPVISVVVTLTMINVVQAFDHIYVMTGGGPGTSTLTLVQYMYVSGFQNFKLGYGSAIGVIVLAVLMLLVILQNLIRRWAEV